MTPQKYRDVRRFYIEKYGKKIGAFKFRIYMLKKQIPKTSEEIIVRNRYRANIIIF
jgi:hypothetical protein